MKIFLSASSPPEGIFYQKVEKCGLEGGWVAFLYPHSDTDYAWDKIPSSFIIPLPHGP